MSHGSSNSTQQWYYGYAPRTLPCAADEPTCAYYEALWSSNDRGILYSGILWILVGVALLVTAVLRRALLSRQTRPSTTASEGESLIGVKRPSRLRAVAASARRYLLPDSIHFFFGRTTRLQILVLAILMTYLTIFSFVGITYAMWPTPVAGSPGVWKYQNSLGLWSNRIGILAYAITPFSVLLASRESILSALTGIPYQSFNFLHRWTGYVILVQSILHAIAWCIICIGLYGPQPTYAVNWVTKEYMIYGICAQFLLIIMFVLSTRWVIRLTGFEFFRKSHYVLAMVYMGTCWGHWEYLSDWMLCGILLWFIDRSARLVRTLLLHHQLIDGDWGFHPAQARLTSFPDASGYGDVVRLDFDFVQSPWKVGQHFYLCFPRSSIWQSHPFTPLSLPVVERGVVRHSYIFRAKRGETAKIAVMTEETTPVVLQGPYGEHSSEGVGPQVNVLAIAGGTGITYVLPVLLELASEVNSDPQMTSERQIHLFWAVRNSSDAQWVEPELSVLRASGKIRITIFVTRETNLANSDKQSRDQEGSDKQSGDQETMDIRKLGEGQQARHPDVDDLVRTFVGDTISGRTMVFASGPGSMITDLRASVAALNNGGEVKRGNERFDVELREDNRLEW
ncbi:uncharacterized protein PgNI_09242 [Pyricularia grisea]|uniref:FAD-binding FR-type domain-containing protein n=1 Tax=Pyricularia grisea TaxID=148305 RepID=A0A6P8ASA3_PYRGI|nr:uncharacterized protein PgNI_09242 [Pyricularia grisea]TLD04988.1 hypothetical protein PgNI_09242 [Pyricularia grisea]